MTKEQIVWRQYKRFKRKYKQELPPWFKPFVLACMDEWEAKGNTAACGCKRGGLSGSIELCPKCLHNIA